MTLVQDGCAPMRQQRWIELENVGSVEVPPFGVCEVVDSYRPEQGTNYTPGDGRTVLRVRMAERDQPCVTVVNGPCTIPVGENRRVGTMDDPMLAQVETEYQPGTVVGVRAGSFKLQEGHCGYLIIGDYDAGTNTQRVRRWEDCNNELMVKAYECIYPGDLDSIAIPMRWNATQRCWEEDPYASHVKVCDCNKWLLALPGECFKVERMNSCESSGDDYGQACYRPSFPYGLTRRVRVKENISPRGCGTATLLKLNSSDPCDYSETECLIQICNTSARRVGCDADEDVTLHIAPGECGTGTQPECYGWIDVGPRALIAKATGGAICGGELGIESIEYIDVTEWKPRVQPLKAKNPLGIYNCPDYPVYLIWNDPSCGWDVLQPTYVRIGRPVLGIECADSGCGIDQWRTLQDIAVQQCQDCGQTSREPAIIGEMVDYVKDVDMTCGTGCSPKVTYGRICKMCADDSDAKGDKELPTAEGYFLTSFGQASMDEDEDGEYESCGLVAMKARYCFVGCVEQVSPDGVDFQKLEPATDVVFDCSSCPTLDWDKTSIWGLCVGVGSAGTSGECECSPCEASSASATPSATGA